MEPGVYEVNGKIVTNKHDRHDFLEAISRRSPMEFSVTYPYKKGDIGRDQGTVSVEIHTLSSRALNGIEPDGEQCWRCLFFGGQIVEVKEEALQGNGREFTMWYCYSTHDGKILVK